MSISRPTISPADSLRQRERRRLTVVGPEQPLADGIVDAFQAEKLRIFGPSKAAAELEASKVFCKNLLRHADVPTADYRVFRNADHAITFLTDREDVPVVVKADGLAAGKGVVVCSNRAAAIEAVNRIARQKEFGAAGNQLVIEERLDGQEVSVLAITDGQTIVTLPPAQDHKRGLRRRHRPQHGRHGGLLPDAAGRRRAAAPHRGARAGADGPRHEAGPAAVPRRALRRADAHQPGAQGAGVQRPLRRPRVPAAADAAARATWSMCWRRRSTTGWTRSSRWSGTRGPACAW